MQVTVTSAPIVRPTFHEPIITENRRHSVEAAEMFAHVQRSVLRSPDEGPPTGVAARLRHSLFTLFYIVIKIIVIVITGFIKIIL